MSRTSAAASQISNKQQCVHCLPGQACLNEICTERTRAQVSLYQLASRLLFLLHKHYHLCYFHVTMHHHHEVITFLQNNNEHFFF